MMNRNRGFSIIELMVVLAILGVIASIGTFAWQRYVDNTNLRTAAREIVADFNTMKRRAVSVYATVGSSTVIPTYKIFFDRGNHNYAMNRVTNDGTGDVTEALQTKTLSDFGHGIEFVSFGGGGATYEISYTARGIMNPSTGSIVLTNGRNSRATITYNLTGNIYVTFAMH